MNSGGQTRRIIRFAEGLVGTGPGGLAHVNVVTNVIYAGISGAAVADAAAIGSIMIPAMKKAGYSAKFTAAVNAAERPHRPHLPAVDTHDHLRGDRQRLGGQALPCRGHSGAGHGNLLHGHLLLFRGSARLSPQRRHVAEGTGQEPSGGVLGDPVSRGDRGRRLAGYLHPHRSWSRGGSRQRDHRWVRLPGTDSEGPRPHFPPNAGQFGHRS